jgi:hypothetical protein
VRATTLLQPFPEPRQLGRRRAKRPRLTLDPRARRVPNARDHRILVNVQPCASRMNDFHANLQSAGLEPTVIEI